jgi:glutamate decarboxylase
MRLLIRHGFSRDMADLLLADFKREIAHLQKHKPIEPLTAGEATSFTHDALPLEKLSQPTRANV